MMSQFYLLQLQLLVIDVDLVLLVHDLELQHLGFQSLDLCPAVDQSLPLLTILLLEFLDSRMLPIHYLRRNREFSSLVEPLFL
jgi:hypothetical protein